MEFISEQTGYWRSKWEFSPIEAPDEEAESESEGWGLLWEAFARQVEGDSELARKLGAPVIQVITFSDLVDKYMDQYQGKDPSTIGRLDSWITRFGDKKVTQIDEFDVDDGLLELAKTLTGSTINHYKSTLSGSCANI